ncbi:MAG: hypothetical protein CMK09_09015 [Ponticaulis sp.]|nr:hypothetical protein [Ponticaulis sp.]|tara:strand:- start:32412 stop:33770 length:1359 start_codon:yes stop_codon:yes gene_type:complete
MSEELKSRFTSELSRLSTPIFLAGLDQPKKPKLTLHLKAEAKNPYIMGHAQRAAANVFNSKIPVKIQTWRPEDLLRPDTLQDFVQNLTHDLVVHDPAKSYERARRLLSFATRLRSNLGQDVAGVFFAPDAGSIVVVLNDARFIADKKLKFKHLNVTETIAYEAMGAAFKGQEEMAPPLRIGFGMPQTALVPVDRQSLSSSKAQVRRIRFKRAAMAALMAAGFATSQTAHAEGPAVSGTNSEISGSYVDQYGDGGAVGGFSVATPLTDKTGFQFDASVGNVDSSLGAVAGQFFMRDPDKYMLGVLASYAGQDGDELTRVGGKGELYFEHFTVAAQVGAQFSDVFDEGPYGKFDVGWYATNNLLFSVGADISEESELGILSMDYRPGFEGYEGLSFYAEVNAGDGDQAFRLGFRSQLYGTGTLKDRDRRDMVGNEAYAVYRGLAALKNQAGYGT